MRTNHVKRKLQAGGTVLGTMIFEFSTTGIARIVDTTGSEFALFDMEHTGWSTDTIRTLLAVSRSCDLAPLVRVPAAQNHFIARVLDLGACGVMVPMVESVEQARTIVAATKYPPEGRRGAAFGVAHDDFHGGDPNEKIREANAEVLVIAQIETAAGLENLEAIAAVEGVDVLWIGQTDLTNSLGIPGQFDHPQFQAALDRVVSAARANNQAAAYMALSVDEAAALHARGFRCLAYSGDVWIYQQALRAGLADLRERIEKK